MKRKRFIKLVMSKGFNRNDAAWIRDRMNQVKRGKSQTSGKMKGAAV